MQRYGVKSLRPDEPSPPAQSHLYENILESILDLADMNNDYYSFTDCENVRPFKALSPAPSHLSVKSNQSINRPVVSNNEAQRTMADSLSAYISAKSVDCGDIKLLEAQNYNVRRVRLHDAGAQSFMVRSQRPDEAPSPATSYFSLKSDCSINRPIVFSDRTQHADVKCLRSEEAPSPAPSLLSMKSNQSMDRPIVLKNENLKSCEAASPAPSYTSLKSNQSMDRPIVFKNENLKSCEAASPAPSYTSLKSDQSMDRPIVFKNENLKSCEAASPAPSFTSLKSDQSVDRPIVLRERIQNHSTLSATLLTENHYKCPVCTEVFKDPVSMPCGHSYCKLCINNYWSKPNQGKSYSCPQCGKKYRSRPLLNVNVALAKLIEELQKAGFSPAFPAHCYAGPKDVPCDICTELKLKAVKSCLTCIVSYCETHVRQHYTVPALQRHSLVEAINLPQKEEESKAFTTRLTELEMTLKERDMQAKRLCKGFEIHCIDFPSDVIEMTALGHSLNLGMLYNSHSNSFFQDIMLEEDTVASMKVSLPRPQKWIKILEQDSIQERFKALDVSRTLLQNGKSALTKLSGAAAFLNHPEQSPHQNRVTLHYRITTRLDLISQRLLQEVNLPSVIKETTATHMVIGVCYGAQAFFVFDDTNERISTKRHAEMENIIKKITTTPNARNVFSSLTETEKTNSSYYYCSLYSDMGVWKSRVSFDEALEICDSLPTVLGSKGEKAVPLKVWLYPLKKLDKSCVCAALSEVSENLIQRADNILEHLRKLIRICQDMITDYINVKVIMWFPALKDKLIQFADLLQEYKTYFHTRVADMKQEEQEKSIQVLLESHDHSQFSADKTTHWLENKETELKILNDCRAADITVVKSQAELQQVIRHSQITRVMCLTLFSPDSEDLFLTALKQNVDSDQTISHDLLPLKPVCINQKVLIDIQLFIANKEANEDAEQTKFIAASVIDNDFPEFSVQFYLNGEIGSRNVKLGIKPNLAQIVQMKHTSVSLMLNQAQTKSNVRYMVEYRALGDDGRNNKSWNQIIFDDKTLKKICMISDLKSGHQYQLRYSVIEQDCMSNFSKIMNFKTAAAATPGQPLVNKLDRDTLRLSWLKAKTGEHCPVLRYMVEYKEAGLEGWSSVQTQGPECEYTLTLSHSTCYRVRVSAVYEDITSQPSEETPVPVDVWIMKFSERKSSILLEVLKLQTEKKPVELIDWTDEESELKGFLQCLPYISQLRFVVPQNESSQLQKKRKRFIIDLCLQAALHLKETTEATVRILLSSVNYEKLDFLLDLYSHVKDHETQTGRSVLPALQLIYQSAPAVWRIKLSERKSSILLEVLKLQTEKKPVELIDWTDEESEVKGFLQCLPYISQLRFDAIVFCEKKPFQFLLNLFAAASEFDQITRENYTERLTSVCSYTSFPFDKKHFDDYKYHIIQCDFLLDLCSNVKDYETQKGRSVLPTLQPIYQSAPAVWIIKLSERKSSILLEVLKLQTENKPVELMDSSYDDIEVNRFLQCLPYISQLRFDLFDFCEKRHSQFLLNLIFAASEFDKKTGGKYTDLLTSVCRFTPLPFDFDNYTHHKNLCDVLLDLWSNVKNYETQTGRSVLPALQPIYQSAPGWSIKLSERKSSILLEVLKLQTEKKPVQLIDWTDEDIEINRFLQCLPFISLLRFAVPQNESSFKKESKRFIIDLCLQAALQQKETIEATVKILQSSVNYEKSDFLLALYSHVKDYETQTGRSVLPALQPVYQSTPAVWIIDLSQRKSSILLEVLKLQTEKKLVELIDGTDEESEVKGFVQCLPYISGLRFVVPENESSQLWNKRKRFILDLCFQAAFHQKETIDATVKILLSSVNYEKSDFLLDLWSNMKDYESQTGKSVLPALQSVFKLAPDVWIIDLSQRKSSLLQKVLKLQTEKKPVELRDWTDECIEVKEFLQCLPYISQLRFVVPQTETPELWNKRKRFILDLCLQAAVHQKKTIEATVRILLSSVNYEKLDFLLDLYSHVKDHETQTGRSVLPALQPIYQSAPAVWRIKLSQRKSSILLEVLKLQTEKKPVELIDWTDEESEVKGFLQCLPYISQLRLSPSFTLSVVMEIYRTRFPQYVSCLMSSTENDISLNGRVLDSVHCAALRFTLQHCNTVKLSLLWTSIPEEELESFLPLLSRVKQLSVDRQLLLKLLHCCSSSDLQEAADVLLLALHNRLDFSCCSALDLTDAQENQECLKLTIEDCRIISSVLQKTNSIVKLVLQDCELSDEALKQLWPILSQVQLSCSKALLLQFLACISKDGTERGSLRRAKALSQALGREMDLGHTQMGQRACEQLALFLEYSEGLTELDLSHCKLTDHCMEPLLLHLHKTQTLDLSHNNITDESAKRIHSVVCTHSNIQTVRLFGNKISDRKQFIGDKRFEMW